MTGSRSFRAALVALALVCSAGPAAAQDSTAAPVLERASQAYRALTGLRASFRQVVDHPMIGVFESRGELAQAGASRFAMRFADPPSEAIVLDGRYLWIYTPSTAPGQVIRQRLAPDPTYSQNVLAWLLDRPTERYASRYLRADRLGGRPVDVVSLTPLDRSLPFAEAVVWLDREDALPRRVEIQERGGNRRTITLSNVRANPPLPDRTFAFVVPDGVRVVDQ